jgi:hypothetical protein
MRKIGVAMLLMLLGFGGLAGPSGFAQCPDRGTFVFNQINSIEGSPFTATEVTTTVTYDAAGGKSTQISESSLYRDGKGRVRVERFAPGTHASSSATPSDILIYDHCGNTFNLRPSLHTGKVQTLPPPTNPSHQLYCREPENKILPNPGPSETFEELGPKSVGGVEAHGTRTSEFSSPRAKSSGEPPIRVHEFWCSSSIDNLVYLHNLSEEPKQEQTIAISEIKLEEPDPSLFAIPDNYKLTKVDRFGHPVN